jgi:DNA-binding XRE family transcriptional regulator
MLKMDRKHEGISRAVMARILQVQARTISNWEHDKTTPSLDLFIDWCIVLNSPHNYILGSCIQDKERKERLLERRKRWVKR